MRRRGTTVDYDALVIPRPSLIYEELVAHLIGRLPGVWKKAYRKMAQSPTSIHSFSHQGFECLFDRASELRSRGVLTGDRAVEDRIIVAYGQSRPTHQPKPTTIKRNLLGAAAPTFGERNGKPYIPGSVLGGWFDISLFPQHRDLEAERSSDGRSYRAMKAHCLQYPGTFCFTRLIYTSRSWLPAYIEHGLLKQDGSFWVNRFRNSPVESRFPFVLSGTKQRRKPAPELTSAD